MSAANVSQPRPLNVAVIGKPNTGKSTLFSAISGIRVQTANYPGVTVERRVGRVQRDGRDIHLIDVPGTYSLTPRSLDEQVTVNFLQTGDPQLGPMDLFLCVVDATQLERGLALIGELASFGRPIVVALNMMDIARQRGIHIDLDLLSSRLQGMPIIATVAHRGEGINELLAALPLAVNASTTASQHLQHAVSLTDATARYGWAEELARAVTQLTRSPRNWTDRIDRVLTGRISGLLFFLAMMFAIFQSIFTWVGPVMDLCDIGQSAVSNFVTSSMSPGPLRSLLVDGVVAGVGGVLIFVPQIALLFFLIGLLEDSGYMARAALVTDRFMSRFGLSGKSFLPLMSSFACAVPGIMATRMIENRRDRFLTILVAPLMSCSARLPVYLLLIGAFVPPRTWLGGYVSLQGLVFLGMLWLGALVAIPVAWLLGRTFFKGQPSGFLLELPDYKRPSLRNVARKAWDGVQEFVVRAGTLIFATSVVVWAAGYFPGSHSRQYSLETNLESLSRSIDEHRSEFGRLSSGLSSSPDSREPTRIHEIKMQLAELENLISKNELRIAPLEAELNAVNHELIESSFLGRAGKLIEPVVRPCGWDWRIGTAVIASFPAREVVIATLGTIFSLGAEVDEGDSGLRSVLQQSTWPDGRPLFTTPVAFSVMVFFALCAQCISTLAVIRRETHSWRWPIFCFVYMTGLAYAAAIVTFQIGSFWTG